MDPFTQRMLEKAEQRSRVLGISKASEYPITTTEQISQQLPVKNKSNRQQQVVDSVTATCAQTLTNNESSKNFNKMQVVETTPLGEETVSSNENKVHRQFTAVGKENLDLGIEINIVTNKDVEVEVQVEEKDKANDDDDLNSMKSVTEQPLAKIRDTSRSRLQRLGALYANPNDISSPIHRTEGDFYSDPPVDDLEVKNAKRTKPHFGKLAELASSINQWEDDTSHHNIHPVKAVPPPKPDLPSRKILNKSQTNLNERSISDMVNKGSTSASTVKITKQLTWDPQVINSLEAQGFQRRDSSTVKLAYAYPSEQEKTEMEKTQNDIIKIDSNQVKVANLTNTFSKVLENNQNSINTHERKLGNVKVGLVSDRTAAFENKRSGNQETQRQQKDPTELSLKERMQLFERNKDKALIPKAALGMAPSISKIQKEQSAPKKNDGLKATTAVVTSANVNLITQPAKVNSESKLREKVAALASSTSTIAESKIKADIQKQRQEDMKIISNRFQSHKNIFSQDEKQNLQMEVPKTQMKKTSASLHPSSPPPPPPMPKIPLAVNNKRHSPSDIIEDEKKRARKSATIITRPGAAAARLYPALSDLESDNSESEIDKGNEGTTATLSGESTADDQTRKLLVENEIANVDGNSTDERNESCANSEDTDDSSIDICNGTLGRVIMQVVQNNENKQQRTQQMKNVKVLPDNQYFGGADSSMNSSEASMAVDDYLDEALEAEGDDESTQESANETDGGNTSQHSRVSKDTTASNSFSFRQSSKRYKHYQTIPEDNIASPSPSSASEMYTPQPVKSELSINRDSEDNMVTLVHTVSFYRRQQSGNSTSSTPVRRVCTEQKVLRSAMKNDGHAAMNLNYLQEQEINEESDKQQNATFLMEDNCDSLGNIPDANSDDSSLAEEKIKKLLDEVCKQQTIIAQTSQALNLCAATIEFSGSTESVEGERHLLVATHRRQACLDEIQRLRVEKCLRPVGSLRDKGHLTVKEITIPLRQDYIRKLAADTISGHHLVCLLKYNEHVLATKTVPTLPGLLAVKFPDVLQMNNVYADFRVTLEIYGMTAQREILPHEVKYHINLNKKSGIKTPKKKTGENRLVMPPVQSPAGPNVVRTPALVQYGFAIFSLREIQRTTWTLTQVLGVSPLEGVVHMKVNCELSVLVEHRGFLTMYEDISGFGAWHRRWCYLNGSVLNYWKYPDDERKKTPIGTIDLYACRTQKVAVAPRDICARLNTMLLEFERPAKETDEESLIIVRNGRNTIVRYLLSADTKEERELWCAYFNKVLLLLRSWGQPQ
ncbi:unnamed protein product [Ceratitis capitata]|uniref:(Mediterranean fruit fly) hypothetical protein n=1 Tax=Ceratitis capitata TaxID=7213 RepID=A0A811VI19_CERCA|nr:unnamed protein product [Ceratitis capitata]